MSDPNHLEKFEKFSATEFSHFFTGSKIASDWDKVKKILGIENLLLDSMVDELVQHIYSKKVSNPLLQPEYEIFESYSEKVKKGQVFELRIKAKDQKEYPQVMVSGKCLEFEKVKVGTSYYWIAVIDSMNLGINPIQFTREPAKYIKIQQFKCSMLFAG